MYNNNKSVLFVDNKAGKKGKAVTVEPRDFIRMDERGIKKIGITLMRKITGALRK